ncbi:MAG: abortive infection protein [Desulfitibacter sp. BRH_c19]|nr:MAG: abortive infection protein [Desulfitibacter sp. BRH_c19]
MTSKNRRAIEFVALTYVFSWLMIAIFVGLGGQWNTSMAFIIGILYMFVPASVAVYLQRFKYKQRVKETLGISFKLNRWFLFAWLISPGIAFMTFGISLLFGGVEYSPNMLGLFERFGDLLSPEQMEDMLNQIENMPIHPIWLSLIQGLIAGVTINAIAGFGEELGWRGYLFKEVKHLGFWKSSFIIGVIWGIWHAPIILLGHNYPEHPVAGMFMMTIFAVLISPIFTYVRIKSGSVIAAAIMHGTFNAVSGLAIMLLVGGNDLIVGVTGLAGFLALVIINILLFGYDRYFSKEAVMHSGGQA